MGICEAPSACTGMPMRKGKKSGGGERDPFEVIPTAQQEEIMLHVGIRAMCTLLSCVSRKWAKIAADALASLKELDTASIVPPGRFNAPDARRLANWSLCTADLLHVQRIFTCFTFNLQSLLRRCPSLTVLSIDAEMILDDVADVKSYPCLPAGLVSLCPAVKRLAVRGVPTSAAILDAAKHCSQLEEIEWIWGGIGYINWPWELDMGALLELKANCPHLRVPPTLLYLSEDDGFYDVRQLLTLLKDGWLGPQGCMRLQAVINYRSVNQFLKLASDFGLAHGDFLGVLDILIITTCFPPGFDDEIVDVSNLDLDHHEVVIPLRCGSARVNVTLIEDD
jgi:hypothetical protein